ncbi:hypothetical protein J6590_099998 [Homalodisca vitripennis]|nr:hypothetical protein J6590_099998 [Homalodisca vitripennis]
MYSDRAGVDEKCTVTESRTRYMRCPAKAIASTLLTTNILSKALSVMYWTRDRCAREMYSGRVTHALHVMSCESDSVHSTHHEHPPNVLSVMYWTRDRCAREMYSGRVTHALHVMSCESDSVHSTYHEPPKAIKSFL